MNAAIIVAAGKGTRMGANMDKLWLEVAGRPVIAHTWKRFNDAACVDEIILVIRDGMQPHFTQLAEKFQLQKPFRFVVGGAERQDSVWNGLAAVSSKTEIAVIQDAARPCTTEELIAATIQAARETGAAVAAQPVTDTIKETVDGQIISRTVDRSKLWSVQTPQAPARITLLLPQCEQVMSMNILPRASITRSAWVRPLVSPDGLPSLGA